MAVTKSVPVKANVFFIHFHPSLIIADKSGACTSGGPFEDTITLSTMTFSIITLSIKGL